MAGATIMPSTMSLIHTMFTDRKQHATAMAVWMGCFMGGSALGPVWLPEHRNPEPARLDPPSVALSLLAVLSVVYGLKELSRNGFAPVPVAAIILGLGAGCVFVARQRRLATPLLDLRLFRNRVFRAGLLLTVVAGLTAGNTLFVSLYLQRVEGLSTLRTALWLLPGTLAMLVVIQLSPLLARKVRTPRVIACGLVVAAAGFLLLTQVDGGLPLMITGMVQGIGIGPMGGLCAIVAMQAVWTEEAGSAAALTETAGELGLAMGVAVLGTIGMAVARGGAGLVGGLNASAAVCAGVAVVAAALVARPRS